eukprot:jgi/Chlat1/7511/Chrsp61S00552
MRLFRVFAAALALVLGSLLVSQLLVTRPRVASHDSVVSVEKPDDALRTTNTLSFIGELPRKPEWHEWNVAGWVHAPQVPGGHMRNLSIAEGLLAMHPQPLVFTLIVFACNRPTSLARLLSSLAKADYAGDMVHLEIIIDRCTPASARKSSRDLALGYEWPHGHKSIHYRSKAAGLRLTWLEAWLPLSKNQIAIFLEDDMEVSWQFYLFAKEVIVEYYQRQSDPGFGLFCLHPYALPNLAAPFYKSITACSWGTVMLPTTWRSFMEWVNRKMKIPDFKPALPGDFNGTFVRADQLNNWVKAERDIWSPWFYNFIHDAGNIYTVTYCFDKCTTGFAINHQEAGENYDKTQGPNGWALSPKPLREYYTQLPSLSSLVLRTDAIWLRGPCTPSKCPER